MFHCARQHVGVMRRRLHRSFEDWVTIIGDGVIITVACIGVLAAMIAGVATGDIASLFFRSDDERRR